MGCHQKRRVYFPRFHYSIRYLKPMSVEKCQAENGHISQAMNGDGNHQIFFFFVSDGKYDPTNNLSKRQVMSIVVGQYKKSGADQDGCINIPSSAIPEDNTSEKHFFPNRTDDASYNKKYDNLQWCGRQW